MDETIYTHILIKKSDSTYLGWSKAKEEKPAGTGMEWIKWNKPIPDDILQAEPGTVKYENGELVK